MIQTAQKIDDDNLFPVYTKDTVAQESQDALNRLEKSVGMIPNLAATIVLRQDM